MESTAQPRPGPGWRRLLPWLVLGGLAFLLYAPTIGARLVWGEECFLVYDDPIEVWRSFVRMDRWAGRPPLFYMLRAFSLRTLGPGGWGMRLPSLIAAALTVPATFRLAERHLERRWALWTATCQGLFALSGYFARESHVYALSGLLLVILLTHLSRLVHPEPGAPEPGRTGVHWSFHLWTLAALLTSLLLYPFLGFFGLLLTVEIGRRHGWGRAGGFVGAQAAVVALVAVPWVRAYSNLQDSGRGVLSMGGEDGGVGVFTENDLWISIQRTMTDLVFGHHFSFSGGRPWVEWLLPAAASAAVLVLAWPGRRRLERFAWLMLASFVGILAVFWVLQWGWSVEHRLEPRYFIHLSPILALLWGGVLHALPARWPGRVVGGAVLGLLLWGHGHTTWPANRNLSAMADVIRARYALSTDAVTGPETYFEQCMAGIVPGQYIEEFDEIPERIDRMWVLHEKDELDRMLNGMRFEMPDDLEGRGFGLAFERFYPPRNEEEFGQVVLLSRYDRGAPTLTGRDVHFLVDLGAWPLTRRVSELGIYQQEEFTLRWRDESHRQVARLEPEPYGRRSWLTSAPLPARGLFSWSFRAPHPLGWLPAFPLWADELEVHEVTAFAVDETEPVVRHRPGPWLDPWLVDLAGVALLVGAPGLVISAFFALLRAKRDGASGARTGDAAVG